MNETTRRREYTIEQVLFLALELGEANWKLGFSIELAQRPRRRKIDARDVQVLGEEIVLAKKRFRLPETAAVKSCYEAGREGFWLHRCLEETGVENLIVDSASIEVNRRAKRVKTDRFDVGKLLKMLIRYHCGEEKVCSVVQVPSLEAEDMRHLHRQLNKFKEDRTRHSCRINGVLASQGVKLPLHADFLAKLEATRLWNGKPLPPGVRARVEREFAALQYVREQIKQLEKERKKLIETSDHPSAVKVRQLMKLRAIGPNGAWLFVMEFFGWRNFRNRREVGALAGLTPTPHQSGEESREQGISKAGNRWVRAMAIEIAWCWLRYQPDSELTHWFDRKFGHSKRTRKIGIVALARRLMVALWRYLEMGEIPTGAQFKPQQA